jgi:hypothetical protein
MGLHYRKQQYGSFCSAGRRWRVPIFGRISYQEELRGEKWIGCQQKSTVVENGD